MNIEQIEAELLRCAELAKAKGLDIVSGEYEERACRDVTGVCALQAWLMEPDKIAFDISTSQEDAICRGFDGSPRARRDEDYYQLGARLREKLNPRPARV